MFIILCVCISALYGALFFYINSYKTCKKINANYQNVGFAKCLSPKETSVTSNIDKSSDCKCVTGYTNNMYDETAKTCTCTKIACESGFTETSNVACVKYIEKEYGDKWFLPANVYSTSMTTIKK